MNAPPVAFVFVHGWGFDAGFWDGVRAHLPEAETLTVDLGFRGPAEGLKAMPPGRTVAVGHSLGFLWLLHEKPFAWDGLVSINGFAKFTASDGFPSGIDGRMVARMKDKIRTTPEAVVADFLGACGHADPPDTLAPAALDPAALERGLDWLMAWDGRAALQGETVLALAGRADPIVPPDLSEASFGRNLQWHEGGHLLPVTAPAWCADRLRAFARTI
ncbi:MAG: alpha/beta hydrolase [Rhodospirillales bacterium]